MNFVGNKKQSVHYRILRSYKDTLHGPSGEIRTRRWVNRGVMPLIFCAETCALQGIKYQFMPLDVTA